MHDPNPQSNARPASIHALAKGWQELAQGLRALALSGKPVDAQQSGRLRDWVELGNAALRDLAADHRGRPIDLGRQEAQRATALRMMAGGCPVADEVRGAEGLETAPSRTHRLLLDGGLGLLRASDLVSLLAARQQVGTLKLRTSREVFTLELECGQVAHLHTSVPASAERLGEILIKRQLLDARQLDEIRQRNRRGRIGEVLLTGNYITQSQLLHALEMQVHLLVDRMFLASIDRFSFWNGPLILANPRLRIDVAALLLEPWDL